MTATNVSRKCLQKPQRCVFRQKMAFCNRSAASESGFSRHFPQNPVSFEDQNSSCVDIVKIFSSAIHEERVVNQRVHLEPLTMPQCRSSGVRSAAFQLPSTWTAMNHRSFIRVHKPYRWLRLMSPPSSTRPRPGPENRSILTFRASSSATLKMVRHAMATR